MVHSPCQYPFIGQQKEENVTTYRPHRHPTLDQIDQQRIPAHRPRILRLLDREIRPVLTEIDLRKESHSIQTPLVLLQQRDSLFTLPRSRQNGPAQQLHAQILAVGLR